MGKLVAACVGLAVVSLLLPSQPTYDPWAWLVWGREIWILDLDTSGGPSWKPLPVAFTFAVAPLGRLSDVIPPALWLVVARAGGLLALALAFRLAARLAGPDRRVAALAGVLAALALLLTPQWLRYMAHGNEAPLAVALMLLGVERHLEGSRRGPVVLGFLACLLRPEAFPFLAVYGAWLWRADARARPLLGSLGVALPALWLVPEWIGSGNPLSAGQQARSEPTWSLSHADQPWLEALRRGHRMAGLPLELGALAALGFALRRRDRVVPALAATALLWLGLVVAMTQAGFSGNARYFLPALVVVCVLAGVGGARLVAEAGAVARPAAAAAVVLLVLACLPWFEPRAERLDRQARTAGRVAALQGELGAAVQAVGGADAVVPWGPPTVNRPFITRLAWELKLPLRDVEIGRGRAVVFSSRNAAAQPLGRAQRGAPGRLLVRVGDWEVLRKAPQTIAARPSFAGSSHSPQQ